MSQVRYKVQRTASDASPIVKSPSWMGFFHVSMSRPVISSQLPQDAYLELRTALFHLGLSSDHVEAR